MTNKEKIHYIINKSIKNVLPDNAVKLTLDKINDENVFKSNCKIHLIAIGKAAWRMSNAASCWLKENYDKQYKGGICITKYGHTESVIDRVKIFEAAHPVLDENTIKASEKAIRYAQNLNEDDIVLVLISGGGSALFESPTISLKELKKVNENLLASGASIEEINELRKKLSKVKGGKYADICAPAKIYNIILSDVLGDKLETIASGPTINKNAKSYICGNLEMLCQAAKTSCEDLGYTTKIIKQDMTGFAKEEANWFAKEALKYQQSDKKIALIAGGETVVKLKGSGKGGRNQEFALACARYIEDKNITIFSFGSDGTDGPTDAAGGFADGNTMKKFVKFGINVIDYINNNDSYNALKTIDQLIITGPTGTNVNDVAVTLIN